MLRLALFGLAAAYTAAPHRDAKADAKMQAELDYEAGEDEAAPDAELKGVKQDDARTTQLADELKAERSWTADGETSDDQAIKAAVKEEQQTTKAKASKQEAAQQKAKTAVAKVDEAALDAEFGENAKLPDAEKPALSKDEAHEDELEKEVSSERHVVMP